MRPQQTKNRTPLPLLQDIQLKKQTPPTQPPGTRVVSKPIPKLAGRPLKTLNSDEKYERTRIEGTSLNELNEILSKFKIKSLLSPINHKRTDNPSHCNQDTLHTQYKQAIVNNDLSSFNEILRQAHNIGTATRYSPAYKENRLLVIALGRAVETVKTKREETIRTKFVTALLSLPEVTEALNKDKKTYMMILNILFNIRLKDGDTHIGELRQLIFRSTKNKIFQLMFRMASITSAETKARAEIETEEAASMLLLNEQTQLAQYSIAEKSRQIEALLSLEAKERKRVITEEQTQFVQLFTEWNKARVIITAEALRHLSLLEAQNRATIVAEESAQLTKFFTEKNSALAEIITKTIHELSLLEAQHRNVIVADEQSQFFTEWNKMLAIITAEAFRHLSRLEAQNRATIVEEESTQLANFFIEKNNALAEIITKTIHELSLLEAQLRNVIVVDEQSEWNKTLVIITAEALRHLSQLEAQNRATIVEEESTQLANFFIEKNNALAEIMTKAIHDLSLLETQTREAIQIEAKRRSHEIHFQERMDTCAVKGIAAISVLPLIETERHEALLTEEQEQFETILAQHQTAIMDTLRSLEEKKHRSLLLQEQDERREILSQAEQAHSQVKLAENQKKLHALGELCKDYLDYALDTLGCDPSQGEPTTSHDSDESKRGKLIKKYEFVKTLYDITQQTLGDTSTRLNEFISEFHKPDHQTLLQAHRDNVFVQFIKSLWEIIKLIPKAFGYLSTQKKYPGFWQPAQGKVLSDALESELNRCLN